MMKRVGLSRFNPLEVGRKVQQCLRFEGVNANGVCDAEGDLCIDHPVNDLNEIPKNEDVLCSTTANDRTIKSNLLNAIKKKWKKSKRNKRHEIRSRTDSTKCQCQNENCDISNCCVKQIKQRRQKCGDKNVWPVPSSILRCQNHQNTKNKNDDVAELISSLADENEVCSCFDASSKKLDRDNTDKDIASCSKFSRSSCSLSDVSCNVERINSDIPFKVESEGDMTQLSSLENGTLDGTYANAIPPVLENSETYTNTLPTIPRVGITQELQKLSKYGWYWGPINRSEAEAKLHDQPDGAFLVRDSSDDRYILSLSFRSHGKILHTRIEHSNGLFSFYSQPEPGGHASIVELIQQSMCFSQSGVFCYSRSRSPGSPSYPVRLTKPVSRFTQVRSLQYLCRFIIRQYIRYDHIQKLPLPPRIKGYLEEGHY